MMEAYVVISGSIAALICIALSKYAEQQNLEVYSVTFAWIGAVIPLVSIVMGALIHGGII